MRPKPLFTAAGARRLAGLDPRATIYAFDFDGTLARLEADPYAAAMSPRTARLLAALAARVSVAIISGRSVKDLRGRIPGLRAALVGNHGMEVSGRATAADRRALRESRRACRAWLRQLASTRFGRGVEVEAKACSLSIHYRRAADPRGARRRIEAALAHLDPPPRLISGKCVVNLVPLGAPHKGSALLRLMARARARSAVFVGDDVTDEDVFGLPDAEIVKIRVGPKRTSAAEFYIPRQSDIDRLLRALLAPKPPGARK